MAVARGNCPSCGAPIEFSAGASVAKVCEYCRATVYRSDRGLADLGKVAALANTPSLVAVGDHGQLAGRAFEVLGRVQLDHGSGPWDEYYVGFDHGARWGWLAYAEGQWFVTEQMPETPAVPAFGELGLERDVALGSAGIFRVAEVKTAKIASAEGELPGAFPPGFVRHYADLFGAQQGFATIDYGDMRSWAPSTGQAPQPVVFVGRWLPEHEMRVTQVGERTAQKLELDKITCPNCGGDVPKLSGERAERLGCPFCGAVSDIASREVIAKQEAAMAAPDIPIGTRGTLDSVSYVCIAYVRRRSDFDGESFGWDEYLLFSEGVGFRWLVKDETTWMWAMPVSVADLDLRGMPDHVRYLNRTYAIRNRNVARVDFVLGELYWRCAVGETTHASDYIHGRDVLSREESPGEVRWSASSPLPYRLLASAFGLPEGSPAAIFTKSEGGRSGGCTTSLAQLFFLFIVLVAVASALDDCGYGPIPVFGGSGYYYGGK